MKIYLLKFFHFREKETLPYREDGHGGNVFHGVGSHILFSDLSNRWYRFAFEVATEDQPEESHLEKTRLHFSVNGSPTFQEQSEPEQSELDWPPTYKRPTLNPKFNSYQWTQHAKIDVKEPCLVTVKIEMKFSHADQWLPVDGVMRFLTDLHPGEPPKYYSKPIWYLRKLLGKLSTGRGIVRSNLENQDP